MKSCAIAVVGHVDHGKTSLVRALTGQETDRLAEEKARGLSITPGFAHRSYETGFIDFIDSPGHEDFIAAMVSGASGAQAALVVISAIDGVEHQTREHLEILGHLGVRCGVVALTKADLVSVTDQAAVRARIAQALAGSPFASEPSVFCSGATGEGLDTLNQVLEALIHRAPLPAVLPGAFLPVDRAFTMKGVGTIATGTLLGAPVNLGDGAVVLPSGKPATVRRLQSRGADIEEALTSMRTAINFRGVTLDDIRRGDVIATPDAFSASSRIDTWLSPGQDKGLLKHGEQVRVLIGTAARVANVSLLGERTPIGEAGGYVRLSLREPVATHAGQFGILRRLSPAETLGGIRVLDPAAPTSRRKDPLRLPVLAAVRGGNLVDIAQALAAAGKGVADKRDLKRLASLGPGPVPDLADGFEWIDGGFLAPAAVACQASAVCLDAVSDMLARQASLVSVPTASIRQMLRNRFAGPLLEHVLRKLLETGALVGNATSVSLPDRDPFSGLSKVRMERLAQLEDALLSGDLSPPALAELQGERGREADLVELLVASGRAVFLRNVSLKQTLLFHTEALDTALQRLSKAFPPPRKFSMSQARTVLGTSRKYAIPILEHFDKVGLTRRAGDVRSLAQGEL